MQNSTIKSASAMGEQDSLARSLDVRNLTAMRIIAGLLLLLLVLTALTYAAGAFAKSKLLRENPPPGQLVDAGSGVAPYLGPVELIRTAGPGAGQYPKPGMPEDVLAQYRAIAVSTSYFQTGVAENETFESNLAEVRNANISLRDKPLMVVSRGYWDAMPGFSETENQQAWRTWQEMQAELLSLSSNSRQVVATESEHSIHLQQPELVIDAIRDILEALESD